MMWVRRPGPAGRRPSGRIGTAQERQAKRRDMQLLYDPRDDPYHERVGSQVLYWLDDLGAVPLGEADPARPGFLFAGARPADDYRGLVAGLPLVRDRPAEREPLLRLDA